jgi:hypothetical protein
MLLSSSTANCYSNSASGCFPSQSKQDNGHQDERNEVNANGGQRNRDSRESEASLALLQLRPPQLMVSHGQEMHRLQAFILQSMSGAFPWAVEWIA